MAKKNYDVKRTPEGAAQTETAIALAGTLPTNQFVNASSDIGTMFDSGFADLSLPPIIKSKGLKRGDLILGEIDCFGIYDDGKNVRSALITVHVLKANPATREMTRIGLRGAIPVGVVLARALGAPMSKESTPQTIIDAIQGNGYGKGTILAMLYRGTGKERKNQNAPHLWDIKAKKPTGEVTQNIDVNPKKK